MANKTINELTEMTSFVENDELAIYDVSNDLTTKGSIKNLFKTPLTDLNTTSKNLIGAINEVATSGGSSSDDGSEKELISTIKLILINIMTILSHVSYYNSDISDVALATEAMINALNESIKVSFENGTLTLSGFTSTPIISIS